MTVSLEIQFTNDEMEKYLIDNGSKVILESGLGKDFIENVFKSYVNDEISILLKEYILNPKSYRRDKKIEEILR